MNVLSPHALVAVLVMVAHLALGTTGGLVHLCRMGGKVGGSSALSQGCCCPKGSTSEDARGQAGQAAPTPAHLSRDCCQVVGGERGEFPTGAQDRRETSPQQELPAPTLVAWPAVDDHGQGPRGARTVGTPHRGSPLFLQHSALLI